MANKKKEEEKQLRELWDQGKTGYVIEREGVRYEVTKNGLVPVTGPKAQETIKKKKGRPGKPGY